MFRANRQTDYAIRMILSLAKREAGTRASTSDIQKEMAIPHSFAQRIIADLARGSFIQTFPGRTGGVTLARPANEINLRQLVEYFEDVLFDTNCKHLDQDCPFDMSCPICVQWKQVQKTMMNELERVNFEYLASQPNHSKEYSHWTG
ncbi:MAG: Rrf2 family transcriptional regulator [Chloroflexi bacterium]|nr:Rrf2 family transcriptional regulator [Chloroflexota bacterium]